MKYKPINGTLKNGTSVQIREGKVDDAQELIQTMKDILRSTEYLLVDEEEFNMTLEQEVAWLKAFDDIPTSLYLVATHNNEIIGTFGINGTLMKKMRHTASMGLSLKKEWRGLGLGRMLMEEGIKWTKEKTNVEILWLDVFSPNNTAISLYEKLGFVEEGRQKNFCKLEGDRYCDKITMSLHLK